MYSRWMVTGGAGFIGSHFVDHLKDVGGQDLQVGVVDNLTYASDWRLTEKADVFYLADVTSRSDIRCAFQDFRPEVVVNFAAESHVDNSYQQSSLFVETNVDGVICQLETIRNHGLDVLFVQVSTDEVYGDRQHVGPGGDGGRLEPQNPYAASKAAAEHFVRAFGHSFELPFMITRSSNNWGPRQHSEKFIPAAIEAKLTGEDMVVHGYDYSRDWLNVLDNVRAIYELIVKAGTGTWNISTGTQYTLKQVLDRLGDVPHRVSRERPGVDVGYCVDSSDTWEYLGWRPVDFMDDLRWDEYVEGQRLTTEPVR